jgi:hypothetical protein
MRNLIRNGGFERGTIDFWAAYDMKSFIVVATPVHKGSYAGKIVCDGTNNPYIIPNDYIALTIGETAVFEAMVRANGMYIAHLRVEYYDEGLALIETKTYHSFNTSASGYVQVLEAISGVEGAIYCRPYIYLVHSTLDDYMLVDNVSMCKLLPEEVMARELLMDERENLTSVGSYFSPEYIVAQFREAEFYLYVDTFAGTSKTLDVSIKSRLPWEMRDRTIVTFTQVTTSGNAQTIVINEGLGAKIRVEAVLAGTGLDCDYYVNAIFKR